MYIQYWLATFKTIVVCKEKYIDVVNEWVFDFGIAVSDYNKL